MALGKPNRADGKAFSLKLATKRNGAFLPRPEWEVTVKLPDGTYSDPFTNEKLKEEIDVEGPLYDAAGDLVSIDCREGSYEDKPIYNVSLNLRDRARNEVYFAGFSVGSALGRKLANAVLSLTAFDNVQVGLYNQVNKETKKVYGAAALRQGDNPATVKGKYDFKTDPNLQPREFEGVGGKSQKDWSKPDLFLFERLKEFAATIKGKPANTVKPEEGSAPVDKPNESAEQEADGEPVPF